MGFFSHNKEDKWRILQSIQNHLFPKYASFPDAETVASVRFLKMVSRDASFDQSDLVDAEKERILQQFTQTTFGRNWISLVLNYTFEALLGDPIYGGNVGEKGWKSLSHHPGRPRPKVFFARLS